MILRDTHEQMAGQIELMDLGVQWRAPIDGYDAEGHLINPDAAQTGDGGTAPATEGGAEGAPMDPATEGGAEGTLMDPATGLRLAELACEINVIEEQARGAVIAAALGIGKRLIEVQGLLPKGRFEAWIKTNVNYSLRKAQDMMRLYEDYGRDDGIPESIARLDYSHAVALLAAPEDAREALAEQVSDRGLSVRQLQAEIKQLRSESDARQMEINLAQARATAASTREAELQEQLTEARAQAHAESAAAEWLRRHYEQATDEANASTQQAADAVRRANDTAKELADAKRMIARLEADIAAASEAPEPRVVEVIPEPVARELNELRARLAEGQAQGTAGAPPAGSASDRFRAYYDAQIKPTFRRALDLLRDVKSEDAGTALMLAKAMTSACTALMQSLGGQP